MWYKNGIENEHSLIFWGEIRLDEIQMGDWSKLLLSAMISTVVSTENRIRNVAGFLVVVVASVVATATIHYNNFTLLSILTLWLIQNARSAAAGASQNVHVAFAFCLAFGPQDGKHEENEHKTNSQTIHFSKCGAFACFRQHWMAQTAGCAVGEWLHSTMTLFHLSPVLNRAGNCDRYHQWLNCDKLSFDSTV